LSGRTIVVTVVAASLLIILLHDLRDAGFAADRLKRIQELEAREIHLYERLAQKDALREAQRQIYIDRIRKGEAQRREQAPEMVTLRGQSEASSMILVLPLTSRD